MLDSFDQKKLSILADISSNSAEHLDASPKGTVDVQIMPLLDQINLLPEYVSTSSCSGRVSVFLEGQKSTRPGAKGSGGKWLFVTHDEKDIHGSWWNSVKQYFEPFDPSEQLGLTRYVLYKFEPMILHVKARDFTSASRLFNAAMSTGFRESGIGSNFVVAIRISMRVELPIAKLDHTGHIVPLVDDSYIETLIELSSDMFEKNQAKIHQLALAVVNAETQSQAQLESPGETKEQRRLRKRQQGLEKQKQQQLQKQQNEQQQSHDE